MKDEEGKLMNDFSGRTKPNEVTPPEGSKRTITVELDAAQYQLDMDQMQETKGEDAYASFNILMRRKPKVQPSPAEVATADHSFWKVYIPLEASKGEHS